MRKLLINFCAFCLLLPNVKLLAQSNLSVIDSLVNQIAVEILDAGENEIKKNVILQIGNFERNISGYLKTKIGNVLTENNYQVFRNFPKDTSFESTVLEVLNCNIEIDYSEPFSKKLLNDVMVQRITLFTIEGQIYDANDNRVILPVKYYKKFKDEIKYNEINKMEESPFTFTYGKKTRITVWQQFLEPAIVVSSVLAVLLLLFTQRS
jgi:hypothetical protein